LRSDPSSTILGTRSLDGPPASSIGSPTVERCPLAYRLKPAGLRSLAIVRNSDDGSREPGAKRRARNGSGRDRNPHPRCSARAHRPLSVASGSGAAVLTECSIGPVAVDPSLGSRALRLVLSACAK
jgi:hypothetical protein